MHGIKRSAASSSVPLVGRACKENNTKPVLNFGPGRSVLGEKKKPAAAGLAEGGERRSMNNRRQGYNPVAAAQAEKYPAERKNHEMLSFTAQDCWRCRRFPVRDN